MEALKEYIENWNAVDGIKPDNDEVFIKGFIKYLESEETKEVTFDGDGAYFGKQVSIQPYYSYFPEQYQCYEIAYGDGKIVIYNGMHNGFWVPPYATLKEGDEYYDMVCKSFFNLLKKTFCIPEKYL